jgi:para-nitrobenzyl esterase
MPDALLVQTAAGPVRGLRQRPVCAWLGVPFARPPVGPLRFRATQPPDPWTAVRNATRYGPSSLQVPLLPGLPKPFFPSLEPSSEDCLYLNVWSPAADGAKRPVLFWIHGGGYAKGTSRYYNGAEYADKGDMVVVTVNYRLGLLGFGNLAGLFDDDRFAHNPGLLDQVAALKWVRDNIERFGGDPGRVTIAGESAGAGSASLLMLMKETAGLFHGAIHQSGAPNQATTWGVSLEIARQFTKLLGIGRDNRDRLWTLPPAALLKAQVALNRVRPENFNTCPYMDGQLFPANSQEFSNLESHPVPLLTGTNADEYTLFTLPGLKRVAQTRAGILNSLNKNYSGATLDRLLAEYPDNPAGTMDLGCDKIFRIPSEHFAERHSAHSTTWRYRFEYSDHLFKKRLGAFHALELLFTWPSIKSGKFRTIFYGKERLPRVDALADRMKRHWISFIREGCPESNWPAYNTLTHTNYIFNLTDSLANDPESARRKAWEGINILQF